MSCSSPKINEAGIKFTIAHPTSTGEVGVLAVVVLYNRPFKDVPCAARLRQWLAAPTTSPAHLTLSRCLIYDNSPVAQSLDIDISHDSVDVFHDASNGGTRGAYLHALKIARMHRLPWILFLDHDTDLPQDLLSAAERALSTFASDTNVCAVVPLIFDGSISISPKIITTYGRVLSLNSKTMDFRGGAALTAISSAALVRVDSLARVLPIPTEFSLDFLDHWLFRTMQNNGEHIVISSARVAHSLSVQSMRLMSIQRYRAVLSAELSFLRGTHGYSPALHLLWLLLRAFKLMLTTQRLDLAGACIGAALNVIRPK